LPSSSYQLHPALAGGGQQQGRLEPNINKKITHPFSFSSIGLKPKGRIFSYLAKAFLFAICPLASASGN
jgi:hypothetical protein